MVERTGSPGGPHRQPLLLALVLLLVGAASGEESRHFDVVRDASRITVLCDHQPLLRYRYGAIPYKPYIEELFTPNGVNILRDSPADHKHHHGLMFAVRVDGVNFWEEVENSGSQKHISFGAVETHNQEGTQTALIEDRLDWKAPEGNQTLLKEFRKVQVRRCGSLASTLLTWSSQFSVPEKREKSVLSGSRYFGLGMRFPESMDKGGRFFNAEGAVGVEGTNAKGSDWCAYTAKVDGAPVTVAVFDAPANPRRPAVWYTMDDPFAYLSATLALDVQPFEVERGVDLVLVYGVSVWDGEVSAEEVEDVFAHWNSMSK